MKILFTITLNCVLLVLVNAKGLPRHKDKDNWCPAETYSGFIESNDKVVTLLCENEKLIEQVACKKLAKTFSGENNDMNEELLDIIDHLLSNTEIEDDRKRSSITFLVEDLKSATEKIEAVARRTSKLKNDIEIAVAASKKDTKSSGCGCKKSRRRSKKSDH